MFNFCYSHRILLFVLLTLGDEGAQGQADGAGASAAGKEQAVEVIPAKRGRW